MVKTIFKHIPNMLTMFSVFIDPILATKSWTDTFVATPEKEKKCFWLERGRNWICSWVGYQLSDRVD